MAIPKKVNIEGRQRRGCLRQVTSADLPWTCLIMVVSSTEHMDVVYKEIQKEKGQVFKFCSDGGTTVRRKEVTDRANRNNSSSLSAFFRRVFLPEGYPQSVSSDYLDYQLWDTLQAFASSISGSLSTQAVLKGVGVGDETATPLAATITWLLRHGTGMCGQILFTWHQGSDLDYNCKKWRLFADVVNDMAMFIELLGPMLPMIFLQPLLCLAGVLRSLVGVAGGATRAAITQHQARRNNISDVAAKDGSQETLVNLTALLVNLAVLPIIAENATVTWSLFCLLTFVHIFANFRAVKALKFATLNKERALCVLDEFFKTRRLLSIEEVNRRESVWLGGGLSEKAVLGRNIALGSSFENVIVACRDQAKLVQAFADSLHVDKFVTLDRVSDHKVDVILSTEAGPEDVFHAYIHAAFTARLGDDIRRKDVEDFLLLLSQTGFRTDYIQIGTLGWSGHVPKEDMI